MTKTVQRKMHSSITLDRLDDAVRREMYDLDNPGFCIACGNEQEECEPDARKYECEACGEHEVYGAQELLMHIV